MSPEHEVGAPYVRLKQQRYLLVGEICRSCDFKIFPPRDICPHCGNETREGYQFSGKGEVFSFTTIYESPTGFDGVSPYTIALVKLDEGPMVTAQLTDLGDGPVTIGMPVEMVVRKLGDDKDQTGIIKYGYKFRPRLSPSPTGVSMSSK